MSKKPEQFDDAETQQRVEAALRAAFRIGPIRMKDIPRKRPKLPPKEPETKGS